MCANLQLDSAPSNPIPIVDHFRRTHLVSTVTEQQRPAQRKNELKPLNKNMRMTPLYKTVIHARAKNRKQDEKQNTYEYN